MFRRLQIVLVFLVVIVFSPLAAESNNVNLRVFTGTWRENLAKSRTPPGALWRYSFTQQPDGSIVLVRRLGARTGRDHLRADGKDHAVPDMPARSVSFTAVNENEFEMCVKLNGVETVRRRWLLTEGGQKLREESKTSSEAAPEITTTVYERASTNGGTLVGDWSPISIERKTPRLFEIRVSNNGDFTYISLDDQKTYTARIDGRQYPYRGPNMRSGVTVLLEQMGKRALREVYFLAGQRLKAGTLTLSNDGKTLTVTQEAENAPDDLSIWHFERQ